MKKIIYIILGIFALIFISTSLSSCNMSVTAVAYTRFVSSGTDYVYYSSDAYGTVHGQIEVYKDEEEFNSTYPIADIEFRFSRCLGADVLDDYKYTLVDLSYKPLYLIVYIYKGSERYSPDKSLYFNGKILTPSIINDNDTLLSYTYEKIELKRTNPKGKINNEKVNIIEYK